MTQTTGDYQSFLDNVLQMTKQTPADGTTFDSIHKQLLNNDTFLSEMLQGWIQKVVNSGVVEYVANINSGLSVGYPSYPKGTVGVPASSQYANTDTFALALTDAIINGYTIAVNQSNGLNTITLDAPSASNVIPSLPGSARDDLVFLEAWRDATSGAWKWRIRVVDGVDFVTYPEGLSKDDVLGWSDVNRLVTAQGGNSSPIAQNTSTSMSASGAFVHATSATNQTFYPLPAIDNGLWIAGAGDATSKTTLNTLDGYVYAIPLFRVRRRNSTAFDPDTNLYGGAQYYSLTGTYNYTQGSNSVTITGISSMPSYVNVGDTVNIVTSGTIAQPSVKITAVSSNSVTIQLTTTAGQTGSLANTQVVKVSGRPDGLYSNIIDASDIVDLRHQVSLTGFNYQALLEKNLDLLLRGQLTTNKTLQYAREYIGVNTSSYTDDVNTLLYLKFDGSINGTSNGSAVTGTAVNGTPSYANGVQGEGLFGTGYGVTYPLTLAAGATFQVEGLFKFSNLSADQILATGYNSSTNAWYLKYNSSTKNLEWHSMNTADHVPVTLPVPNDNRSWHYVSASVNGSAWSVTLDEVTATATDSAGSSLSTTNIVLFSVSSGAFDTFQGVTDLIRISDIIRTTTPLPASFSYANGDRILDGPDSDFSMWSDDVGGTSGVNGRMNPYGITRIPNQVAGRISYNGSEIRHYYGEGITPGWLQDGVTSPSGAMEGSGEYIQVNANETADGTRTVFTVSKPANTPSGAIPNSGYSSIPALTGISSVTVDSSGTYTITYSSAPASGSSVYVNYNTVARHAHFIPSTKGFVLHDWTDDSLSAGATPPTVYQTTKYNVTGVNQVRVNGAIQNGGYSTSGLNAQTTLTAGSALNATTISVASASNFVANQNIRISNGDGTWYTTTVTSVSGNTITVPVLTKALNQNATVQGVALVTFTTAPANGATVDIVYESVLTPSLGDYIRVAYQHTPYQGTLNLNTLNPVCVVEEALVTTLGTGKVPTSYPSGYMTISQNLPMPSGYSDSSLKADSLSVPNSPNGRVQGQELTLLRVRGNVVAYADHSGAYGARWFTNGRNFNLTTAQGYATNNRGVININPYAAYMDLSPLSASVPHLGIASFIAEDTVTEELYLVVVSSVSTDSNIAFEMQTTTYNAIDTFKIQGRPLIKSYGGVAA